jgi:hypothetical protein
MASSAAERLDAASDAACGAWAVIILVDASSRRARQCVNAHAWRVVDDAGVVHGSEDTLCDCNCEGR